jgi:hypothetical protein
MGAGGGEEVRRWLSGLEVEVVGRRLIELELRHGLGLGGVEPGRLIRRFGEEFDLGRPARGRKGRGAVGKVEVEEDGTDDGGSVRNARIFISPPHAGHRSGSTS